MSTHDDDLAHLVALADSRSTPPPLARLAWTALIDIDQRESLGAGPQGERFIVPIRGGRFWGGPGFETLRASVDPPTQWSLPRAPSNARRFDSLAQPAGESVRAKWHSNDNGPSPCDEGPLEGHRPELPGVLTGLEVTT